MSTEDPEDDFFVGAVEEPSPLVVPTIGSGTDPWTVDVLLNNCRIEFQIDTGADVSVVSEETQGTRIKTFQQVTSRS